MILLRNVIKLADGLKKEYKVGRLQTTGRWFIEDSACVKKKEPREYSEWKPHVTNNIKIQDAHGVKALNISYIINFKKNAASKEALKLKELFKLRISKTARIFKQRGLLVTEQMMRNYQKEF